MNRSSNDERLYWEAKLAGKPWPTRITEGFLYLPVKLEGKWKWLQRARWLEVLTNQPTVDMNGKLKLVNVRWVPVKWEYYEQESP